MRNCFETWRKINRWRTSPYWKILYPQKVRLVRFSSNKTFCQIDLRSQQPSSLDRTVLSIWLQWGTRVTYFRISWEMRPGTSSRRTWEITALVKCLAGSSATKLFDLGPMIKVQFMFFVSFWIFRPKFELEFLTRRTKKSSFLTCSRQPCTDSKLREAWCEKTWLVWWWAVQSKAASNGKFTDPGARTSIHL